MTPSGASLIQEKLDRLRTELADLAFLLERRGRLDAAEVAMTTWIRVREIGEELESVITPDRTEADSPAGDRADSPAPASS